MCIDFVLRMEKKIRTFLEHIFEPIEGCAVTCSRADWGPLINSLCSFPAVCSSDAVLLHLPGAAGVLPVRRHGAGCVLSGGPSAQASQHQGSPRQAGAGGGV